MTLLSRSHLLPLLQQLKYVVEASLNSLLAREALQCGSHQIQGDLTIENLSQMDEPISLTQ